MKTIVGACLSQFHDDPGTFELLIAFSDGREVGFCISRKHAAEVASVFAQEFSSPITTTKPVGTALADALAERRRQVEGEGWIHQHDDQYRDDELSRAATCYLLGNPGDWPWSRNWWKPTERRRDLIKAAALIIAEIERLDRAAEGSSNG